MDRHLNSETLQQIAAHEWQASAEAVAHLDQCEECLAALEVCTQTELLLRMAPLEQTSSDFTQRVMREVVRGPVVARKRISMPTRVFGVASVFALLTLIGLLLPISTSDQGVDPILHRWIESFGNAIGSISTSAPALALVIIALLLAADAFVSRRRIPT